MEEYWDYQFGNGETINVQAATDTVCLADAEDATSCTADFKWLVVTEWAGDFASGLPIDAMFGLSSGGDGDTAPLLMHSLYADGVVSENKFSIALKEGDEGPTQGASHIDFGSPDPAAMTDEADTVWLDVLNEDAYWTNSIRGIRFDGLGDDVDPNFAFPSRRAYTDTSSACITGPSAEVDFILAALSDVVDIFDYYENEVLRYVFDCDRNFDSFRSIYLLFGDHWFELRPKDYIYFGYSGKCSFCMLATTNEDWTLGANFLRGWYAIHDYSN